MQLICTFVSSQEDEKTSYAAFLPAGGNPKQPAKHCKTRQAHKPVLHVQKTVTVLWHCIFPLPLVITFTALPLLLFPLSQFSSSPSLHTLPKTNKHHTPQKTPQQTHTHTNPNKTPKARKQLSWFLSETRLLKSHFVCVHVHMCTHLFAHQKFSLSEICIFPGLITKYSS